MDLPILGTIDLTPTGVFLFFAATLAVVYFGWQLFGIGRAGRDAKKSEEESGDAPSDDAPGNDQQAGTVSDDDADGSQKP